MSRTAFLTLLGSISLFAFGTTGAIAGQVPSGCTKDQGTITCSDPVGNSENSGGQSQTRDTTSQGNLTNKKCTTGPGNQTTC
jgi:hypothetical protein